MYVLPFSTVVTACCRPNMPQQSNTMSDCAPSSLAAAAAEADDEPTALPRHIDNLTHFVQTTFDQLRYASDPAFAGHLQTCADRVPSSPPITPNDCGGCCHSYDTAVATPPSQQVIVDTAGMQDVWPSQALHLQLLQQRQLLLLQKPTPDDEIVHYNHSESLPNATLQLDSDATVAAAADNALDTTAASWQCKDSADWTPDDVLNVVYYIGEQSSSTVDLSRLRGERFQRLTGRQLCRLSREQFAERDPEYGRVIYDGLHRLLAATDRLHVAPAATATTATADWRSDDDSTDSRQLGYQCVTGDVRADDQWWRELLAIDLADIVEMIHFDYDIDCSENFENILTPPPSNADHNLVTGEFPADVMDTETSTFCDLSSSSCHQVLPGGPATPPADTAAFSTIVVDIKRELIDNCYGDVTTESSSHHMDWTPTNVSGNSGSGNGNGTSTTHEHPPLPLLLTPALTDLWWLKRTRSRRTSWPDALNTSCGCGGTGSGLPTTTVDSRQRILSTMSDDSLEAQYQCIANRGSHLWEFMLQLLVGSRSRGPNRVIQWEDRQHGVFRIVDSKRVADLWGQQKNNSKMTYEKLSRALRWCRTFGFLDALPKDGNYPKKLCFRFGPRAKNWRQMAASPPNTRY